MSHCVLVCAGPWGERGVRVHRHFGDNLCEDLLCDVFIGYQYMCSQGALFGVCRVLCWSSLSLKKLPSLA